MKNITHPGAAMLFGDCLRQLLAREGIAPGDLAGYLEIDVSLIYRWLRHERVPGLNSNYTARIAEYLSLGPAALGDLRAAQVHSLSIPRQARAARASATPATDTPRGSALAGAAAPMPSRPRLPAPLAELPRAITGRQPVFDALLAFLRQLPTPAPPGASLLLTFQGEDATTRDEALQQTWRRALRGALAAGWAIEHYLRVGDEAPRAARLATDLLVLLGGHGRYRPLGLAEPGLLHPPLDLLVGPPDVGAVLLLATGQGRHHDAALVVQHPGQVAHLRGYLRQLGAGARPLARAFPPADRAEYWRALTRIEERPGRRGQKKEGLSVLTRPPAWYAEGATWWRRHGHTPDSAALWRRRVATFERQLRPRHGGHRHRDIIPQEALDHYVATGIHLADLRADGTAVPDTAAERLEHLDRLLDLLRPEQYELALVGTPTPLGEADIAWEVKEGQAALLQAYAGDGGEPAPRRDYLVDEPALVGGFVAVFERQWDRLAFHERDQPTVRQVVEAKRDALRRVVRQGARP